ncbi:hypothetical protein ACOMHN_006802 [Nucella lapillus]
MESPWGRELGLSYWDDQGSIPLCILQLDPADRAVLRIAVNFLFLLPFESYGVPGMEKPYPRGSPQLSSHSPGVGVPGAGAEESHAALRGGSHAGYRAAGNQQKAANRLKQTPSEGET